MQPKSYVLLKHLPDSEPGDIYIWNDSQKAYYKHGNVLGSYWTADHVENNPEWFEEVKQQSEQRDWVVECFVGYGQNYWRQKSGGYHSQPFRKDLPESHFLDFPEVYKIHSVRRLSDKTVWEVEEVTNMGRITGFHIELNLMVAEFEGNSRHCDICLLRKLPSEQDKAATPVPDDREPYDKFEVGVETLINKYALENKSDTPDYISAEFIRKVFELFNQAISQRTKWYSVPPESTSQSKQQ